MYVCMYIVAGTQVEMDGSGRTGTQFSVDEEEEMLRLARDPNIYEKLARSIAPQISGSSYIHTYIWKGGNLFFSMYVCVILH